MTWGARRRWSLKVPVLLALVQTLGTRAAAEVPLTPVAYALLTASALALVLRPVPSLGLPLVLAPTAVYYGLGLPDGPGFVAAIVAVTAAAKHGGWPKHRIATVAAAYALYAYLGISVGGVAWGRLVAVAVGTLVILSFSEAARVRKAHFEQVRRAHAEQERARQDRIRAQEEQQRRQASEERLRIAQELHDVLGHHLSLINVQAGVGLHLMDSRPEQARAALTAIKQASAEALRDTRAVLAALHPPEGDAPRAPTPGLADLDRLVAETTAAGLRVALRWDGSRQPLPSEVDRAAYRIVQEALTNVRRHAGPDATTTVHIGQTGDVLVVEIADDGKGSTMDSFDGNGIAGMRQRAIALGGTVTAGPGDERGFVVRATLPCT